MNVEISYGDARTMFNGTLVSYKGTLVYFHEVTDRMMAYLMDLEAGKVLRVPFRLVDFSYPKVRLGYVNMGDFAFYVQRAPARVYKFGISHNNITFHQEGAGGFRLTAEDQDLARQTMRNLANPQLLNTIIGNYPTFAEAVESVRSRTSRLVAFDRQLALSYKGGVYFKGELAGAVDLKKEGPVVFSDIRWKDVYRIVGVRNRGMK